MKLNSKIFLSSILMAGIITSVNANPVVDVYAGAMFGAGGATIYNNTHSNVSSESFGAMLGIDIPLLRVEAEYNHITNDKFSTNDAMLNAYFKMLSTMIHPYVGVGVGSIFGGSYNPTNIKYDIKSTVAYQGMLGATISIPTLPFKIDVEGRALLAPEMYSVTNQTFHAMQYDARVKLRYIF